METKIKKFWDLMYNNHSLEDFQDYLNILEYAKDDNIIAFAAPIPVCILGTRFESIKNTKYDIAKKIGELYFTPSYEDFKCLLELSCALGVGGNKDIICVGKTAALIREILEDENIYIDGNINFTLDSDMTWPIMSSANESYDYTTAYLKLLNAGCKILIFSRRNDHHVFTSDITEYCSYKLIGHKLGYGPDYIPRNIRGFYIPFRLAEETEEGFMIDSVKYTIDGFLTYNDGVYSTVYEDPFKFLYYCLENLDPNHDYGIKELVFPEENAKIHDVSVTVLNLKDEKVLEFMYVLDMFNIPDQYKIYGALTLYTVFFAPVDIFNGADLELLKHIIKTYCIPDLSILSNVGYIPDNGLGWEYLKNNTIERDVYVSYNKINGYYNFLDGIELSVDLYGKRYIAKFIDGTIKVIETNIE